jgi:hypothetical protein
MSRTVCVLCGSNGPVVGVIDFASGRVVEELGVEGDDNIGLEAPDLPHQVTLECLGRFEGTVRVVVEDGLGQPQYSGSGTLLFPTQLSEITGSHGAVFRAGGAICEAQVVDLGAAGGKLGHGAAGHVVEVIGVSGDAQHNARV